MKDNSQRRLVNKTKDILLATHVLVAQTFWQRAKGLIGRRTMEPQSVMWFPKGGTIHTYFMSFAIDVVFADKNLRVQKIALNVHPWSWVWARWNTQSVFEFNSGTLTPESLNVGDQLHVDG